MQASGGWHTCGLVCSRLVSPVRKLLPLRATNCAVSLMTSKSRAVMPSGSTRVYCSWKRGKQGVSGARWGGLHGGTARLLRLLKHDGLEVRRQLNSHLGGGLRRLGLGRRRRRLWKGKAALREEVVSNAQLRLPHLDRQLHASLLGSEGCNLLAPWKVRCVHCDSPRARVIPSAGSTRCRGRRGPGS